MESEQLFTSVSCKLKRRGIKGSPVRPPRPVECGSQSPTHPATRTWMGCRGTYGQTAAPSLHPASTRPCIMALREIRSNAPTPSTDRIVVVSFNSEQCPECVGHTLTSCPHLQSKLKRGGGLLHLISDLLGDGFCHDSAEDITDRNPANPTVQRSENRTPTRNRAVRLESFSRMGRRCSVVKPCPLLGCDSGQIGTHTPNGICCRSHNDGPFLAPVRHTDGLLALASD